LSTPLQKLFIVQRNIDYQKLFCKSTSRGFQSFLSDDWTLPELFLIVFEFINNLVPERQKTHGESVTGKSLRLTTTIFVSALSINSALALPIDWTGVFGVDTHMLSNTCRTSDKIGPTEKPLPSDTPPGQRNGTQALRNGDCDANFQTYTLRLNPNISINDGVTLKGELSTGYFRGGFAGGDAANGENGSVNNSYFFTTPNQRSALNVNQMYMELYADTALIKIGRMSRHYGLGLVFDSGSDPWDRFLTMYDGIEAEMKIGNFSVTPHYAKISNYSGTSNGSNTQASGIYDVRELGLMAKYDNKNRDFIGSILYAKRSSERRNSLYKANSPTVDNADRGKTAITVIEPYLYKRWNKLKLAAVGGVQRGGYGKVLQVTSGDANLSSHPDIHDSKILNGTLVSSVDKLQVIRVTLISSKQVTFTRTSRSLTSCSDITMLRSTKVGVQSLILQSRTLVSSSSTVTSRLINGLGRVL
jgi:hypothetical protein